MGSRTWVNCPVCEEPDMRQETDDDGYKLIECVNHNCLSNGGTHFVQHKQPPNSTED